MTAIKHHPLTVGNRTVTTDYGLYDNDRLAISYVDIKTGEKFATLTVNLPEDDHNLNEGEFFVKTWSENENISNAARTSGHYQDTGKRIQTGFVEAEIWKFASE